MSKNFSVEIHKWDVLFFIIIFAGSVLVNYFLTPVFRAFWFIGLLILFFFSRKGYNYFWIVFFWLLFSSPGYLFYNYGIFHLPFFSLPGLGREVYYEEIFALMAIVKAIVNPVRQRVFYHLPLYLVIGYSVFLLLTGLIRGLGLLSLLKSVRYFIPILLLPMLPRLIPYLYLRRAIILLFCSAIILFTAQMFDILTGKPVAAILGETRMMFAGELVGDDFKAFDVNYGTVRTIYGPFILLISLMIGMVLQINREKMIRPLYIYLVASASILSIFLSATRGWILGMILLIGGFSLIQLQRISLYMLTVVFFIVFILFIPELNLQFGKAFERVMTLESMVEGDPTAEGTLERITERSPRVMKKFRESPVIGFGFSDEYYEYSDGHVGNQTLLLNGGVVGFGVYLFFIFYCLTRYYAALRQNNNKAMFIFIFGLISLIVIHSTSAMIFGFATKVNTAIAISFFFLFSDYYLRQPVQNISKFPLTKPINL